MNIDCGWLAGGLRFGLPGDGRAGDPVTACSNTQPPPFALYAAKLEALCCKPSTLTGPEDLFSWTRSEDNERQLPAMTEAAGMLHVGLSRSSSVTTNLPGSERPKRWQQVAQAR